VSIRRLRQPAGRVEIGIAGTEGGRERPLLDRGTGLVGRPGESAIPAREGIDELADPFDDLDLQAGMILLGRVQVHLQVGRPAPQGLLDEPDGEIAFIVDELLLMITFQGEHAKDQPIDGRHAERFHQVAGERVAAGVVFDSFLRLETTIRWYGFLYKS
jgi:hypothetical protein